MPRIAVGIAGNDAAMRHRAAAEITHAHGDLEVVVDTPDVSVAAHHPDHPAVMVVTGATPAQLAALDVPVVLFMQTPTAAALRHVPRPATVVRPRNMRPGELPRIVELAAAGYAITDPDVARLTHRMARNGSPDLTGRERDVIECLARGLAPATIAERLSIAPATVKYYLARLRRKLGLQSRADLIVYARDLGYAENES